MLRIPVFSDLFEYAVDAAQRLGRHLEMQVRAVHLDEPGQGTVKIEGHDRVVDPSAARVKAPGRLSYAAEHATRGASRAVVPAVPCDRRRGPSA